MYMMIKVIGNHVLYVREQMQIEKAQEKKKQTVNLDGVSILELKDKNINV